MILFEGLTGVWLKFQFRCVQGAAVWGVLGGATGVGVEFWAL